MALARNLIRWIPMGIPIAGNLRNAVLRILDPRLQSTAQGDVVDTPWGPLHLEASHPPERLLSYAFYNIMRHYENSELGRYIRRIAVPNKRFVDIGANLGIYTLVARKYGLATVAVEPEPKHAAFLKRNEATFGKVLAVAVSDAPGELPLYYEKENPGATSLFPAPTYVKGEGVVPVRTFSALAEEGELGDVSAIRLVKIDVEGFEGHAVAGMRAFLEQGPRPDIWCEVRGDASHRNGGSYRKVRETLAAFGYRARELRRGRDVHLNEAKLSTRGVFDLLFTPERLGE